MISMNLRNIELFKGHISLFPSECIFIVGKIYNIRFVNVYYADDKEMYVSQTHTFISDMGKSASVIL